MIIRRFTICGQLCKRIKTHVPQHGFILHRSVSGTVKFCFVEEKDTKRIPVEAEIGKTVLDVALANNVDIEGACGGELACSTCHVTMSKTLYDSLPTKSEEEQDMLDLAWGLKPSSRLCCQLKVTPELENAEFIVPAESNNLK